MPERIRSAAALALVAIVALTIGIYRFHHDRDRWSSDGAIYLRMTLQANGAAPEQARTAANAYMRTTGEGRDPASAAFYTDAPPAYYRDQFALFRSRPLYPRLAAVLYPRFGPDALRIVSVAGYVGAVVAMYLLLLHLVPRWAAVIGACALAMSPPVLSVAALPLTDALALALWIAALAMLLPYLRRGAPGWLAGALAAAALLAFVRPAIYLPIGVAAGAYFVAPKRSPQRTAATHAALAMLAVACVLVAYTLAVHGPGVAEQLRWQYEWQRTTHARFAEHGFFGWWLLAVAAVFGEELVVESYRHNALFPIVLAVIGFLAVRRTVVAGAALGGAVACLAAMLANPTELQRTVTLPLTPIVVLLATIALARISGPPSDAHQNRIITA